MPLEIKTNTSYYYMEAWVLAYVIQLATTQFCRRFLNLKNDPCGRQYDQMTQAARSGTANIAEGCSRHQTSIETEMRLIDVARASLAELQGDYYFLILGCMQAPWSIDNPEYKEFDAVRIGRPTYSNPQNLVHESGLFVLESMKLFDKWFSSDDMIVFANCMLNLTKRCIQMLQKKMQSILSEFRQNGGFREAMTAERIEALNNSEAANESPRCPDCGAPMRRKLARAGRNSGKEFWSCSKYPACKGTLPITATASPAYRGPAASPEVRESGSPAFRGPAASPEVRESGSPAFRGFPDSRIPGFPENPPG